MKLLKGRKFNVPHIRIIKQMLNEQQQQKKEKIKEDEEANETTFFPSLTFE